MSIIILEVSIRVLGQAPNGTAHQKTNGVQQTKEVHIYNILKKEQAENTMWNTSSESTFKISHTVDRHDAPESSLTVDGKKTIGRIRMRMWRNPAGKRFQRTYPRQIPPPCGFQSPHRLTMDLKTKKTHRFSLEVEDYVSLTIRALINRRQLTDREVQSVEDQWEEQTIDRRENPQLPNPPAEDRHSKSRTLHPVRFAQ